MDPLWAIIVQRLRDRLLHSKIPCQNSREFTEMFSFRVGIDSFKKRFPLGEPANPSDLEKIDTHTRDHVQRLSPRR